MAANKAKRATAAASEGARARIAEAGIGESVGAVVHGALASAGTPDTAAARKRLSDVASTGQLWMRGWVARARTHGGSILEKARAQGGRVVETVRSMPPTAIENEDLKFEAGSSAGADNLASVEAQRAKIAEEIATGEVFVTAPPLLLFQDPRLLAMLIRRLASPDAPLIPLDRLLAVAPKEVQEEAAVQRARHVLINWRKQLNKDAPAGADENENEAPQGGSRDHECDERTRSQRGDLLDGVSKHELDDWVEASHNGAAFFFNTETHEMRCCNSPKRGPLGPWVVGRSEGMVWYFNFETKECTLVRPSELAHETML
jgi:hypothetical protein